MDFIAKDQQDVLKNHLHHFLELGSIAKLKSQLEEWLFKMGMHDKVRIYETKSIKDWETFIATLVALSKRLE